MPDQFTQQQAGWGRVRQKKRAARLYPDRVQYDLRKAARNLHLRVMACQVEIWNPDAKGKSGTAAGAPQWIDVIAKHMSLGLVALDIAVDPRYASQFSEEKRAALAKRGIPYLVLEPAGLWELEARTAIWIRQLMISSRKETK